MQHSRTRKKLTNRQRKKRTTIALWIALCIAVLGCLFAHQIYGKIQRKLYPMEYTALVAHWSAENGLDPLFVYTLIRTESGFDPNAQSNVDARGLMQITEETFAWIKSKIAPDEDLVFEDLYKPEVNIRFGTYYLGRCMARYAQDMSTAAAAYHSGWGTVDKLLSQEAYTENGDVLTAFPYAQMQNYVIKIANGYEIYNELYGSEEV